MGLKRRLTTLLSRLRSRREEGLAKSATEWALKSVRAVGAALVEIVKLAREMLVIPAQVWLLIAEIVGAAVLRVWLTVVFPALRAAWRLVLTLYYASIHQVTPRRAIAAVGLAAAVALVASQWLDYRSVSVGTPAYQGDVDLVAPAPDVARDRAGEAHAWVMIPIAALGALGVALAYARHPRAAWLTIAAGLGAVAIAVGIDAPKGLDEGPAEVAYEGAAAHLLEGFWAQIASGAALAGAGLLSLAYGRPERVAARRRGVAGEPVRPPRPTRLETRAQLDTGTELL